MIAGTDPICMEILRALGIKDSRIISAHIHMHHGLPIIVTLERYADKPDASIDLGTIREEYIVTAEKTGQ